MSEVQEEMDQWTDSSYRGVVPLYMNPLNPEDVMLLSDEEVQQALDEAGERYWLNKKEW